MFVVSLARLLFSLARETRHVAQNEIRAQWGKQAGRVDSNSSARRVETRRPPRGQCIICDANKRLSTRTRQALEVRTERVNMLAGE